MFRMPEKLPRVCLLISGAAVLTGLVLTVKRWAFDTLAIDAITYTVYPAEPPTPIWPFLSAALAATAAAAALKRLERIGTKLAPCWLLLPLFVLPHDFVNLAAALAVVAWSLSRFLNGKPPKIRLPKSGTYCFVLLLSALVVGWSLFIQRRAFGSMCLAYQDWGEYSECYLKLVDGEVPLRSWPVQAGHFNLLPNLIMSTLFRIWRTPETVFFVSAILLGVLPVLIYRLAREHRLPRNAAALFGFAAAFSPILINQSLSLFYGFHPVLFQGVLIVGFFIFERRRCRIGMTTMIALSFLVQETAAALWFGYALYLLSRKRFRFGTALALASLVYFAAVSRIVMPFACGSTDNPQLFHYAQLGDSLWGVLLSPLVRPRVFWGTVFQKQNLFFAAALLLPCGVLALRAPRRMLIALPLFAGVMMQESGDVKNPVMQYGFEITVVLLCAAVAAAGNMLQKRTVAGKNILRSGIRTVAVMSLLCALGWSRLPIGLYSAKSILRFPDATGIIDTLRRYSDPGGRVLSNKNLRPYYMFDRRTAPLDSEWKTGDTVVLDLADTMESVDSIRRRLLNDRRAVPCFPPDLRPSRFVVWKITGAPRPPWGFLCRTDEKEFQRIGLELQQDDPAFEARVTRAPDGRLLVLVRLKNKIDYDVTIELKLRRDGKESYHPVGFGNIYPMWYATPGDTFIVPIPDGTPTALQLAITRRK